MLDFHQCMVPTFDFYVYLHICTQCSKLPLSRGLKKVIGRQPYPQYFLERLIPGCLLIDSKHKITDDNVLMLVPVQKQIKYALAYAIATKKLRFMTLMLSNFVCLLLISSLLFIP